MSEMSKKARSAAKSKVDRLTRVDPKMVVDASEYVPPGPMNADNQVGPRPVRKRQYKSGGKVMGFAALKHAGRKPRASGGSVGDSYEDRDLKTVNESREGGNTHRGGMKRGGHSDAAADKKLEGGGHV